MTPFDALLVLVGGFLFVALVELCAVLTLTAFYELRRRAWARRRPRGVVLEFAPRPARRRAQ